MMESELEVEFIALFVFLKLAFFDSVFNFYAEQQMDKNKSISFIFFMRELLLAFQNAEGVNIIQNIFKIILEI